MSKVYFTKNITSDGLVKIYDCLERKLGGRVAVKISTGELGGHNYLKPELIKDLVRKLNGTIVECNTAYDGKRGTTEEHLEVCREHGFLDICDVDILDSTGEMKLEVHNGKHLKENIVGANLANYDSVLILSHFKGHAMGGFGGALKNISIGIASRDGKALIHTAGKVSDAKTLWKNLPNQNDFLESMAEASESVISYMNNNMVYINVLNNLSVDCDCDSDPEDPCMNDIGILASTDPVALDVASLDMIYNSNDKGRDHLVSRIESKNGRYITEYAESINIGTKVYDLIDIDK